MIEKDVMEIAGSSDGKQANLSQIEEFLRVSPYDPGLKSLINSKNPSDSSRLSGLLAPNTLKNLTNPLTILVF